MALTATWRCRWRTSQTGATKVDADKQRAIQDGVVPTASPRVPAWQRRFGCQQKDLGMMRRSALLCVVIVLNLGIPALALAGGDAAHGEQLAQLWCAGCHVIGSGSPQRVQQGPPTFRS